MFLHSFTGLIKIRPVKLPISISITFGELGNIYVMIPLKHQPEYQAFLRG